MTPMKPQPRGRDAQLVGTLSLRRLAQRWNTSRQALRHMLGRQALGFVQIRGKFRVPLEEIERHEREREKDPG